MEVRDIVLFYHRMEISKSHRKKKIKIFLHHRGQQCFQTHGLVESFKLHSQR